jgi:Secretion system C-terminal sorting domain
MSSSIFTESIRSWVLSVMFAVAFPGVSYGQIIGFFPQADSITVRGGDLPPGLICHVIDTQGGVDTIDIKPTLGVPMYAGGPSGQRIDHCFFAVHDSLNLNQYRLYIRGLPPFLEDPQIISFDSSFYLFGRFIVSLYVETGSGNIDSSEVRFYADATGGVEPVGSGQPSETRLLPNFPNPFNPTTTIGYELAHASLVSLKVYNILGQEVNSLVEQFMPAGFHSVQLTMPGMASGVYICSFQAGGVTKTSKLVLLR